MSLANSQFKYCSECGTELTARSIEGLLRTRLSCDNCGIEHHNHPQVLLTCFISSGEKLLWIRRALEPKRGCWAIPGGFCEIGESLAEGAARELYEEAGIALAAEQLQFYMLGTITYINQIYIAFRATVANEDCKLGSEASQAQFFSRRDFPWHEVAYPEANMSIQQAYSDLESGVFKKYHSEMSLAKNIFSQIDSSSSLQKT